MKFDVLILLLMISSVHGAHRRILHQPLFPASSYPPPDTDSLLPPLDSSDQPFFPEDPNGGTQNQTPVNPPPPPPSINGSTLKSTASTKPTKRAAIAIAISISIGIVTLGILSTLLFFICRNKEKHPIEERNMEDVINGDGYRAPPSRFLYIGTVNPHDKRSDPSAGASSSPDVIKHAIIPSIKKTPPPQEAPPRLPPEKKNASVFELKSRAKFGPPPPPPNLAMLQSISTQSLQPPPPPPPSLPAQPVTLPPHVRSTWTNFIKRPSESQFLTPPASEAILKEELGSGGSSSGRPNGDHTEGMKPRLKPLHWDKVRATSDRATAWDQLKPSSFPLNEDMMESLFGCNSNKLVKNEPTKRSVLHPVVVQENRVLDPKKSQNIAILLRALNVTRDEVSEALLDGNTKALGAELLETLVKMAPTKEEEIKLTGYQGEASKLGSAEKFLKAVLDIPFAFKRVEAMLYRANFDAEVKYLSKSFQTLEEASSELRNSRLFLKLLEAVLTTGNRMNVGTNRGGAKSFTLDTLLKLVDIKGTDGKTTLLHFVVQEIIRSENQTNSNGNKEEFRKQGLSREFGSVKLAAVMDSNVLHSNVSKLETGLQKVKTVLQYEKSDMEGKFFESMKAFHSKAKGEICRIKDNERKALTQVKEVTEYFQGDVGKEEARPLGIFVIVRDFLSSLDHVCKDVGTVQDRQVMGASRSFRISSNAPLPVLSRYNVTQDHSSSEESSSP